MCPSVEPVTDATEWVSRDIRNCDSVHRVRVWYVNDEPVFGSIETISENRAQPAIDHSHFHGHVSQSSIAPPMNTIPFNRKYCWRIFLLNRECYFFLVCSFLSMFIISNALVFFSLLFCHQVCFSSPIYKFAAIIEPKKQWHFEVANYVWSNLSTFKDFTFLLLYISSSFCCCIVVGVCLFVCILFLLLFSVR